MAEPIVDIDRLKVRVNLDIQEQGWDKVLAEAVMIGTSEAENLFGIQLAPKTNSDVFDIVSSNYFNKMGPDGYYTLVLRNCFAKNVKVSVKEADGSFTDVTSSCEVNSERGIILMPTQAIIRYVKVEYASGVVSGEVPRWMEDLILTFAALNFTLPNESKQGGSKDLAASIDRAYASHHRQVPFAIRPIN